MEERKVQRLLEEAKLRRQIVALQERGPERWPPSLDAEATRLLVGEGFNEVQAVRQALLDRRLDPRKTPMLGPQLLARICAWAGVARAIA